MPKKVFTPAQIVKKLRQIDRLIASGKAASLAYKHTGITEQMYRRWRREYGGLAKRLMKLDQELEARTRDLSESLEQQTATSEILHVISRSPTDVQPVFDAILTNATRLCAEHMGQLGLYDGEKYQTVAHRGANADYANFLISRGRFELSPGYGLGRMIAERQPIHVPDFRESPAYRDRNPNIVAAVETG